MLAHYTDRPGLEGIAKSKTLWAFDFQQMNDRTELEYSYVEFMIRVLNAAESNIRETLKLQALPAEINLDEANEQLIGEFRKQFASEESPERLYVSCFARVEDEDQRQRGHLTLWERYTKNKGYCLLFDKSDLMQLLSLEGERRSYGLLDLAEVHYKINENSREFRDLQFQVLQRVLSFVQSHAEIGFQAEFSNLWPISTLAHRSFRFCATHKDPFFTDEREMRIVAVPAKKAAVRPFVGVALTKPIQCSSNGRHYVDLGADWRPGIQPREIIVGPKASRDLGAILGLFERKPVVRCVDFPLAESA